MNVDGFVVGNGAEGPLLQELVDHMDLCHRDRVKPAPRTVSSLKHRATRTERRLIKDQS